MGVEHEDAIVGSVGDKEIARRRVVARDSGTCIVLAEIARKPPVRA